MSNTKPEAKMLFKPAMYWREIIAFIGLFLAFIFFRSERRELHAIIPHLESADRAWIITGFAVTGLFFWLQGAMYRKSFAAVRLELPVVQGIVLFLKRNFLSVFLPAGGVSSLAYTPSYIRQRGLGRMQVHQASGIYAFVGLLTVFLAGLPVIAYLAFTKGGLHHAGTGLISLLAILVLLWMATMSLRPGKYLYRLISKYFPSAVPVLDGLFTAKLDNRAFGATVLYSLGIELCGMAHVYIAMLALGLPASVGVAAAAYIISVLLMLISPLLRGLGAVEMSLVYIMELYGYSAGQALAITILYRVFEFWLPLVCGFLAFAWKGRKLFLRLAPVLLIFLLGIINIVSVMTPPIHHRLMLLREYIPLQTVHASNLLVLYIGLMLVVTAAFLLKGFRAAWTIAILLSFLSLLGHLGKALDYEEAIFAAVTLVILLATAKQYRRRASKKWLQIGFSTALFSLAAVLIAGFISFYFIDKKHFGIDFTWKQSLEHTFRMFFLLQDDALQPVTRFGHEFVALIRWLGFLTWAFVLFALINPYLHLNKEEDTEKERAKRLVSLYGQSSVDYFKLYRDKQYFFSTQFDAFIAYRVAGGFAIVLEEPVCAEEDKAAVIREFDAYCRKTGWKAAYYRVDENSVALFGALPKLMIGQEAIVDVQLFNLEGKDKKSLRNGLNSLQKKGFTTHLYRPPHEPALLKSLKKVSDEWLEYFDKGELVFSQGLFDTEELQQQDIITVEDAEGEVKAFLNIIPDFSPEECTYDLIRRTADAPGAAMDALIIQLIQYAKERKQLYLNMGLVPLTGIEQPVNTAEQLLKMAATRIKRFGHYKGLREFKEKYATMWENKYLIYENDFDLLQLPVALNRVMKP
ncbi:MAG TPA: phosphatidylglycerol lysyltransferase domain-containing protein [Chitinophagaceae bacterium]|nr:phosphatidylglycerol lysyltransferase domain-containing protein [Chitinophagaceae bacterium]